MERLRFANQLRGIAALAVACSHLIGVYWAMPEVVSWATLSPPQTGGIPGVFALVAHPWFNLGPFGVALFFLISGLVIPISLEKHSRISFIGARLLRIYPTYAAAVLIECAVLYVAAHAWGREWSYGWKAVLSNALLIYDLIGQPSIDLVNWTLSIELKFYLLVALLAPAIRRGNAAALLGVACCIMGANALMAWGVIGGIDAVPSTPAYTFSSHSLCLIYMLIGTMFNFHLRGRLGTPGLLGCLALLAAMFVATWQMSVWRAQYPIVTANYLYGLVLFGALYAGRRFVPRNQVLDAMAAISFPFYALHSLIGFAVLRSLMVGAGMGYYPALAIAVAVVVATAAGLHFAVELPSIAAGRRLAPQRPVRARSPRSYPEVKQTVVVPASKL